MSTILIKNGVYRNQPVNNVSFTLVKGYQTGAKGGYVTVKSEGFFGEEYEDVRIKVSSIEDLEFVTESVPVGEFVAPIFHAHDKAPLESDDQVMDRIEQRFEILQQMTRATISGDVRAMIVVGPPGVGKSYGVELELEKSGLFDKIFYVQD